MTAYRGGQTRHRPAESAEAGSPASRRSWWKVLGPGVVTGAADDDPSSIATYAQAGAKSAAQAAGALKPAAGSMASTLFALGFIGAGMLAVPVLAGSVSVGLAGLTGKPWGLSKQLRRAPFFYGLLAVATIGGTALTVTGINPIRLLVLAAVVNGVAAAPFLLLVMVLSENRELMGEYRNKALSRVLGWAAVALMSVASVAMLVLLVVG